MSAVLALEAHSPAPSRSLYAVPEDPHELLSLARSFGPLREVLEPQAAVLRAATDYAEGLRLLPKWQRGGDGIHEWVPPRDYAEGLTYERGPVLRSIGANGTGWRMERVAVRRGAPHLNWRTREHWTDVVVPAALAERPEALQTKRGGVRAATFQAYCHQLAKHAETSTGRRCIVRVDKLAQELSVSKPTVQRCQLVAEALGLYVVLRPGRMLDQEETYRAREHGSRQRGMANDAALVIPAWLPASVTGAKSPRRRRLPVENRHLRLVDDAVRGASSRRHDTPTSGRSTYPLKQDSDTPQDTAEGRFAGPTEPAPPARALNKAAARKGRQGPSRGQKAPQRAATGRSGRFYDLQALAVARDLVEALPWLSGVRPGSIEPMLRRFATRNPGFLPWTAHDVVEAITRHNGASVALVDGELVTGRKALTRGQVRHPHGLLAHYLRQFDPDADHPRFGEDPDAVRSPTLRPRQVENQLLLEARRAGVPAEQLAPPSAERRAAWVAQIRADLDRPRRRP